MHPELSTPEYQLGDAMPQKMDHSLPFSLFPERLIKAKLQQTDDGTEKSCTRCAEFWPADLQFFRHVLVKNGYTLRSICRGCECEIARAWTEANFQPPIEVARKRRRSGTLVIITYRGHHYAALYPLDADTSKPAIYRDLRERGYGSRNKSALFQPYDPTTGRYLAELKKLSRRFAAPVRRRPSNNHIWRVSDRNSYLLYQARRGKAGEQ